MTAFTAFNVSIIRVFSIHSIMPLVLTQQLETTLPIDVQGVTPKRIQGLTVKEIAKITVWHGRNLRALGELFKLTGDADDSQTIVWDGQLSSVHSIGAGVFLFEVQQPSDITYRLYDHDREPRRELHVTEGFDVMQLDARFARPAPRSVGSGPGWERFELVDMGAFTIERWVVSGALEVDLACLAVLHGVSGAPSVHRDGETVELAAGASLVHSAPGSPVRVEGDDAELLVAIHRP